MEQLKPEDLEEAVKRISKECDFPVSEITASRCDYSRQDIVPKNPLRDGEVLVGCMFYDKHKSRLVRIEDRVYGDKERSAFGAVNFLLGDARDPEEAEILIRHLHNAGFGTVSDMCHISAKLDGTQENAEFFLRTYFTAQNKAYEFIAAKNKMHERHREEASKLLMQYSPNNS